MHLIYITFPHRQEAVKVANILVKANLVACANIYENITSIYKWEGEIEQTQEVTMICKTPDSAVDNVIQEVKQHHPYALPCIIAIKIEKGNEDFLKWVENCNKVAY
jgi:periplasmic divalent cation tolerance protein